MLGQIGEDAYQAGLFEWAGCNQWDCKDIARAAVKFYNECSNKTSMTVKAYVHGAMHAIETTEDF